MNSRVMYVKIRDGLADNVIAKRLEESLREGERRYYNFSRQDMENYQELPAGAECYLVALLYDDSKITTVYLGQGKIWENDKGKSIRYLIEAELSGCTAVENICKLSELDLTADFPEDAYVSIEESELIAEQIDFIIREPSGGTPADRAYGHLDEEDGLDPLAQRNEYCRRQYDLEEPAEGCSEFQKDYERIVHSKAFRRMVDKAQVFSAAKGDYYRTRMTHSQVVVQIARRIASSLKLNLYLTEAIALGHDIGHTPFGHQGERTLNAILLGKEYHIIQNLDLVTEKEKDASGADVPMGFKHNYQSVRVAAELEETYAGISGMDLSYQTLEGMLKHTRLKRDVFSLNQFVSMEADPLHFGDDFCSTLEGQVVAAADEIAQRGHDLDDAFSSGALTAEELKKYLTLRKTERLSELVEEVDRGIEEAKRSARRLVDEGELRNGRIVSAIISYFTKDVIDTARAAMDGYDQDAFAAAGHVVTETVVGFSQEAKKLNDYLETIISNRVINNPEVSLFDRNAATVVSGLFRAYYNDPRLLHKGTKRRLYIHLRKGCRNVIDFEFGNHGVIRSELELMSQEDLGELEPEVANEYAEKRRVLVRCICDFIAGMTDSYAMSEYHKIAR